MGLLRKGLDPRNFSGRLYYIPHTKKRVYREMYTFGFCLIRHIFLTLWPWLQQVLAVCILRMITYVNQQD